MAQTPFDLQININLGPNKYILTIPSNASLPQLVFRFLSQHNLSKKYYDSIVSIATQHLAASELSSQILPIKTKQRQNLQNTLARQINNIKDQHSVNNIIKDQNINNNSTVNLKKSMLSKIQQELQSSGPSPAPQSRKVYQKWKLKQKQKKQVKLQNKHESTSNAHCRRQNHSPDFFYKKGLNFKKQCEQFAQQQFKKLYPFKNHQRNLSETDKNQLFVRLHKQKKAQYNARQLLQRRCLQERNNIQNKLPLDPIKARLRQEDEKVDREVFKLLRQGNFWPRKDRKLIRQR